MIDNPLMLQVTPNVPPLLMTKPDGSIYTRPREVEYSLMKLYGIPRDLVAERSEVVDQSHPDFVLSECVLHFVRQKRSERFPEAFGKLFTSLRQRLLRGLWVPLDRLPGESEESKVGFHNDVCDFAMDHFLSMMCSDQKGYDKRLDHFEVRFNQALRFDRIDATKKALRRPRLQGMPEEPSASVASEFGSDFVSIFQAKTPSGEEIACRNEVVAAINSLPDDEKRVMRLVVMGYSNVEIAEIVDCADKTVYNRRKRAEAKIAECFDVEDRI